jgi:RHS repeat-associated protein
MPGTGEMAKHYSARASEPNSSYYRARYYDPSSGRFLNEDPLRFDAGINFYLYGINGPINGIDPFGMSFWRCFGKGLIKGAVVTAAVVGTAAAVVAIAPEAAAVVTGALLVGGAVGIASSVVSIVINPTADNIGYNLGSFAGSAIVGGASGKALAGKLSPPSAQPPAESPLISSTLSNAWRNPSTGRISPLTFFRNWVFGNPEGMDPMKTGPDTWGARGAATGTGLTTKPLATPCGQDGC